MCLVGMFLNLISGNRPYDTHSLNKQK